MKGSVQQSALQSWAEFGLWQDLNLMMQTQKCWLLAEISRSACWFAQAIQRYGFVDTFFTSSIQEGNQINIFFISPEKDLL